jgi:hypothetical protein
MDRKELLAMWKGSYDNVSLVTSKHHPSGIGTPMSKPRSVMVQALADVNSFLQSGNYKATRYHNADHPKSPEYIVMEPHDPKYVAGSGIPANTPDPTGSLDRIVAVSGVSQGWHVYAEDSTVIQKKIAHKTLTILEYL